MPPGAAAEPIALPAAAAGGADGHPAQIVVVSPDEVVAAVADALAEFLTPVADLPAPTVTVLQVSDRSLGIGKSRGLPAVGAF